MPAGMVSLSVACTASDRPLFSTYLVGCENAHFAPTANGLVVVSRSDLTGGRDMGKTPAVNAVQSKFGGKYDGHVFLLELP